MNAEERRLSTPMEAIPNERLRHERELRGWSQTDIAARVGTDSFRVSLWETGKAIPSPHFRQKLCELFGKNAEELGLLEERTEKQTKEPSPLLPYVFLSYSQADEAFASSLKGDLERRGIDVKCDRRETSLVAEREEDVTRNYIRDADAVILIASPNAHSASSVEEELQVAEIYGCPVYVFWIAGKRRKDAIPPGQSTVRCIDARNVSYEKALEELVAALHFPPLAFRQPFVTPPVQETTSEPRNPYKALRAFRNDEARDFFGRDQLVDELIDKLEEILTNKEDKTAKLLAVVGPSGSGKSSIVMAGLLPRLEAGELSESKQWVYLHPILPGGHPLEALALTLAKHIPERSLDAIREDLEADKGRGLHLLTSYIALVKPPETKIVVIVDQFEELFTQVTDERERRQFIDLLFKASTDPSGSTLIILTLRADLYDRPMHYIELGQLIDEQHISVFPLNVRELQSVIEGPATLPDVQLKFEGRLVEDLLSEVQGQVGALPLLQFTLDQLFQKRRGHLLTRSAYREMEGVKGALRKQAESTYANLPSEEHRRLAHALFVRLIDPGVTDQDTTRRRASFSEFLLADTTQTRLLRETADAFITARMLTTSEIAGLTTIEVSHEALIREWPRLSTWLREAREDIALQQTISRDAAVWGQQGRPEDRLYRGNQLAEAQEWAERNTPSKGELTFLQISATVQEQRQAEERVQQAQKLELERRVTRRQRSINVLTAVILVLIIVGLIGASLYQGRLLTAQSGLLTAQSKLLNSLPVSVTNLNDHGPGSLRDAIKTAHSGKVITFARNLGGTIRLTSGDIRITTDVAVIGPGASVLAISGEHKSRVFTVNSNLNVAIYNLTVKDGDVTHKSNESFEASGGGIFTELLSALTLTNVVITGNAADFGGGIYNHTGNVTITNSTISNNTAQGDGGGIESKGTLTITNSTISNNTAVQDAGGIDNQASLSLTNSTISGNTVSGDAATTGYGGGILNTGTANVIYSTLYGNKAVAGGGIANAIANQPANGIGVFLETSIVAGDTATRGPDIWGTATLYYPSLIQNTSSANFSSGPIPQDFKGIFELGKHSLLDESPKLGPLQNNGGPTQTYALLPGSPAIDQMKPDASDQICGPNSLFPTDQRGVSRSSGIGCDLGAYEYMPS